MNHSFKQVFQRDREPLPPGILVVLPAFVEVVEQRLVHGVLERKVLVPDFYCVGH